MSKLYICLLGILFSFFMQSAYAGIIITMYSTATGKPIGTITAANTRYGLLFSPNLSSLTPGDHGFHVHMNPSCANAGMAAGGHLDPDKTNKHRGPYNNAGHLGDLPALFADKNGNATLPVLAPRLKLSDIIDHSLMVHAGGDNYLDTPPMGGGGARIACGIVK